MIWYVTYRPLGEVWLAKNMRIDDVVIIKRIKQGVMDENEKELELLKNVDSPFLVRYVDVKRMDDEIWVRHFSVL